MNVSLTAPRGEHTPWWHVVTLGIGLWMLSVSAWSADATPQSRVIVKWKAAAMNRHANAVNAASSALRSAMGVGLNQRRSIGERMEVLELDAPLARGDFNKALGKLNVQSDIEFAVADERRFASALPDDPLFLPSGGHPNGQWYLSNVEVGAVNALDAWNWSTGGSNGTGVIVAVVDTGVRFDHPDLLKVENGGKLLPGYDFVSCDQTNCSGTGVTYFTANDGDGWDADASDPGDWITQQLKDAHPTLFGSSCEVTNSSWHGTRVSGIIGAATNNALGMASIGYNVRILPVRVLGRCGGYDSDIIAGMRWAAGLTVSGVPANPYPAKVINMSLGSSGACSSAYVTAISEIRAHGVNIVASAGNESATTDTPANCSGVIAVAGVRNSGTKVGFSNLISSPAKGLAAPAGNCINTSGACLYSIDTAINQGTTTSVAYGSSDSSLNYTDSTNSNLGTSFSAPLVAGTIGLMLGVNPALPPDTVTSRLLATATAFPTNSAVAACVASTSTTAVTTNQSECNCTTSTCGAGMLNASKAVQSVVPPSITITGASSLAGGDSTTLDGSASSAADGQALHYTWSIISGTATLSTRAAASTVITVPDFQETVVAQLIVSDDWNNTASQTLSITVNSGNASSSSSASSTASASAVSSPASSGGGGGGKISGLLLIGLLSLVGLRLMRSIKHERRSISIFSQRD